MSNPANMRVYYDEDINGMTQDEISSQLEAEISEIEGIMSVDVERVFQSRPYEAVVVVEFDGMKTFGAEVQQKVSLLEFLDKAILD